VEVYVGKMATSKYHFPGQYVLELSINFHGTISLEHLESKNSEGK